MVSGACGIDFALLVVAADDGVMPQTREHIAILELLGISRGAVALTKVDRVNHQRLREVETEIKELLQPTSLRNAPIFSVNGTAADDPGTAELRHHLHETAACMQARHDEGLFRLAVDRVFTLPGHGTIVAGTVFSGRINDRRHCAWRCHAIFRSECEASTHRIELAKVVAPGSAVHSISPASRRARSREAIGSAIHACSFQPGASMCDCIC